jgi:hypothetical protein
MRIFWRILAALVLIAALVGIGFYAYSLGVNQGLAEKVAPATAVTAPLPYFYPMHPFFMFGWGPLGCLIPLFLLCLVFGSFRALIWHGPMGMHRRMHMHGRWGWHDENGKEKDFPPFFDEWHRRAHGETEEEPAKK